MSLRAARSRAISSIDPLKSMPMTEQFFGYSDRLMPVPTPTSSTRSPGWMSMRSIACSRPGCKRGPEGDVIHLGQLVVDPFDEIVLDGGHRQRAGRGVRPGDEFILANRLFDRIRASDPSMS